ncbi:MAG TPA: histidine kinase [Thiothrix sp.]|nr:histidine kinase [Thiothrix sp.]
MSISKQHNLAFLPNICTAKSVIRILLAGMTIALILALAAASELQALLVKFGLNALFILWTTIMSIILICMLGKILNRVSSTHAGAFILAITTFFTCIASVLGIAGLSYSSGNIVYWDTLFVLKNIFISGIITLLALRYFYVQQQWNEHVKSDSNAKYDALQSRMRPHFLFNSLNTIAQLITVDPVRAEDALLDLADIFRTTLDKRNRITLGEELDVTMRYLRMEGLRLGKRRLSVVWDMEKNALPFEMLIPPLLLQPLVENAIYHGIQPRKEGGTLGISLYETEKYLDISVSNPVPPEGTTAHSKGNHIAQENLKKRLDIAYGDRAKLSLTKTAHLYRVAFRIPKENI